MIEAAKGCSGALRETRMLACVCASACAQHVCSSGRGAVKCKAGEEMGPDGGRSSHSPIQGIFLRSY